VRLPPCLDALRAAKASSLFAREAIVSWGSRGRWRVSGPRLWAHVHIIARHTRVACVAHAASRISSPLNFYFHISQCIHPIMIISPKGYGLSPSPRPLRLRRRLRGADTACSCSELAWRAFFSSRSRSHRLHSDGSADELSP